MKNLLWIYALLPLVFCGCLSAKHPSELIIHTYSYSDSIYSVSLLMRTVSSPRLNKDSVYLELTYINNSVNTIYMTDKYTQMVNGKTYNLYIGVTSASMIYPVYLKKISSGESITYTINPKQIDSSYLKTGSSIMLKDGLEIFVEIQYFPERTDLPRNKSENTVVASDDFQAYSKGISFRPHLKLNLK